MTGGRIILAGRGAWATGRGLATVSRLCVGPVRGQRAMPTSIKEWRHEP